MSAQSLERAAHCPAPSTNPRSLISSWPSPSSTHFGPASVLAHVLLPTHFHPFLRPHNRDTSTRAHANQALVPTHCHPFAFAHTVRTRPRIHARSCPRAFFQPISPPIAPTPPALMPTRPFSLPISTCAHAVRTPHTHFHPSPCAQLMPTGPFSPPVSIQITHSRAPTPSAHVCPNQPLTVNRAN